MKLSRKLLLLTAVITMLIAGTSCNTSSKQSLSASMFAPSAAKHANKDATVEGELEVATGVAATDGESAGVGPARSAPTEIKTREAAKKEAPRQFVLASANTSRHRHQHGHAKVSPSMVGSNLLVRTTAYCHKETDSLPYGKLSAAGGQLQYGSTIRSAAADWSRFPLGTRFRIEGQPYEYVIDDYGSALTGTNTIDIYKPTISAMNQWGARHVPIQILEWGCFHKSHQILDGRRHVKGAEHVRQMLRDIESRYVSGHSTAHVLRIPAGRSKV